MLRVTSIYVMRNCVCFTVVDYAQCQRKFAQTLIDFKFETIGSQQTDEEIIISKSLSLSVPNVSSYLNTLIVYSPFKMLSGIPK